MARRRLGERRNCVYHAKDRTAHRAPVVQPVADYLASLPASDNPNAFIFPNAASAKRTASLSNQFRDILPMLALLNRALTKQPAKGAHVSAQLELSKSAPQTVMNNR